MNRYTIRRSLPAFGLAAVLVAAPAAAQTAPSDPDTLIGASQSPATGVSLARSQIADRDLLGAAGTLERVLLAHPEAIPPRLLYASLLCRLDDRQGAELEVRLLSGRVLADADWSDVSAACGDLPRPAPPNGGRR